VVLEKMSFYIRKALLISSEILPVPGEKEKAVVGVRMKKLSHFQIR